MFVLVFLSLSVSDETTTTKLIKAGEGGGGVEDVIKWPNFKAVSSEA